METNTNIAIKGQDDPHHHHHHHQQQQQQRKTVTTREDAKLGADVTLCDLKRHLEDISQIMADLDSALHDKSKDDASKLKVVKEVAPILQGSLQMMSNMVYKSMKLTHCLHFGMRYRRQPQ